MKVHHLRFRLRLSCVAAFALLLANGCDTGASRSTTTVVERWADGSPRVEREVMGDGSAPWVNHGVVRVWHENGSLRSRGTWKGGKKHGRFEFWYADGQPLKRMEYVDGRAHGVYREWDADGQLVREERWVHGRRTDSG